MPIRKYNPTSPGQRFQTVYEMYMALQAVLQGMPAFRRVDFLRALRDYTQRHRRYGQ